jgi:hypothetical protein
MLLERRRSDTVFVLAVLGEGGAEMINLETNLI